MKKSEREKLVQDLVWAAFLHHGRWRKPGELIQKIFNDRIEKIKQLTSDDFNDVRKDMII